MPSARRNTDDEEEGRGGGSETTPFLSTSENEHSNRSSKQTSNNSTLLNIFDNQLLQFILKSLFLILGFVILSLLIVLLVKPSNNNYLNLPISSGSVRYGYQQCLLIDQQSELRTKFFNKYSDKEDIEKNLASNGRNNPRVKLNSTVSILIRSVTIWDGLGNEFRSDIYLKDGIINKIGKYLRVGKNTTVIDGRNKILTPGLVDMHSHIGVSSWPELDGTDDTNEMTSPALPQLRTIDAFNANDLAIPRVRSGGVTTVLVLPGSGNLIGGEAFAMKLRTPYNLTNEERLVNYNIDKEKELNWRYIKMACGENPKRVYGSQNKSPSTRMGSAYILREKFAQASKLVRAQDQWCNYLSDTFTKSDIRKGKVDTVTKEFPQDISLETLSHVIRGNVQPHIHCYEPEDLESMVRLSEEYNFQIWAFHHALDAYRVPDLIKRAGRNGFNVTIATFSDGWGYKKEAYEAIPESPSILADNNIPIALKTDHPVVNSQYLMFESIKAYHAGLNPKLALAAVTSVPAKALGLDHRIGKIQAGMDADLVLWNESPFTVGSTPIQVFIDGIPQIETKRDDDDENNNNNNDSISINQMLNYNEPILMPKQIFKDNSCKINNPNTFIITGLSNILINQTFKLNSKSLIKSNEKLSLIVHDNEIIHLGVLPKSIKSLSQHYEIIDLNDNNKNDGYMIPGLIAVNTKLGMIEIEQEPSTGDGDIVDVNPFNEDEYPFAKDGLRFGGKHLRRANDGGITAAISPPQLESGILAGYSTTFYTDGTTGFRNNDLIKDVTALHITIGHEVKSKSIPTITQQFNLLRNTFKKAIIKRNGTFVKDDSPMGKVIKGVIPLVAKADNKDDISRLIELRNEIRDLFHNTGGFGKGLDLIIIGGVESWMVADQLANEEVSVILQPVRCAPDTWSRLNCLSGPPLTQDTTFTALNTAGVKVGFAPDTSGEFARDLIWEASWAYQSSNGSLSEIDAIGLVAWNLSDMFHLGEQNSEYLFYDQSPLNSNASIKYKFNSKLGLQCP